MLIDLVNTAINIVILITLHAVFISVKLDNQDGLKNQNILVSYQVNIFSSQPIGQSCSNFYARLFVGKKIAVIKFLCQGQINSRPLCKIHVHPDPIPNTSLHVYKLHNQMYKVKTKLLENAFHLYVNHPNFQSLKQGVIQFTLCPVIFQMIQFLLFSHSLLNCK